MSALPQVLRSILQMRDRAAMHISRASALLPHCKAPRYLGIEFDDALEIAEQPDV